jgi:hypothetical protein
LIAPRFFLLDFIIRMTDRGSRVMQAERVAEFQTLLCELLAAGLTKSAAEFPGVVIELSLFYAHELDLTTSNLSGQHFN